MTARKTTKIDLHVHTRGSDGWGSPEEIVRYTLKAKLDGLCLTDHHLTYTAESLEVARALRQAGLLVFHGCEYSTAWGHMLVYGVNVEDFQWGFFPDPRKVISDVNDAGGLCVLAHPYKGYRRMYGDRVTQLVAAAGIETANGQCTFQDSEANRKAAHIADTHCLGTFGGSDAHTPRHIGLTYTVFDRVIHTQADLLRAMRAFKGFRAVTSKKRVAEELSWRLTTRKRNLKRVAQYDLLPGLDLDSYPETRQVPEHDGKFWDADGDEDWKEDQDSFAH